MSSPCHVFKTGKHTVKLISVQQEDSQGSASSPPPKPLLVSAPCEEGEFPVLVFLHGFLLYNSFYTQLLQHISSHGFIVVAPQLYTIAGPDSSEEISDAAKTTDWLINGLVHILPNQVQPNLNKLAIAGHSRGGKVAFALALGYAKTSLTFSALMAFDPVDGMDKGKQTNPPILTYIPHSFELKMAALVIGSGLGGLKKNLFFPPCSPQGVSHQDFFDECKSPACHLVAKDYGHLDILDDETKGIRGKATYCLCAHGKAREPMRSFVGGALVAFMRAYLEGDMDDLWSLWDNPELAIPVAVSIACFQD
ncbi:chlorophyllase-2, chloroplastic-like [Dendrobium catenatum]|uniref:chlorophyllase n=1 Tax=Dendrobium catenatum TaxID=906689 RepID=A0A2I0X7B5_9ASPA|nr:chlorophyllase-2, chloroplastic-like [Dendrobium catenatum]PKU83808.1 Chlorophyllase-2, chloroplastic [Dendrobium catenatum]